jgi:GT2 family glycosyltransferase
LKEFVVRKPEYSIVVPVFNRLESTEKCLASVAQMSQKYDYEIIVVANGCHDGTEDWVLNQFMDPRTVLVSYHEPLGGGEAINVGLRLCKGEYYIVLNNDTKILGEDWIDILRAPFVNPRMGVTGPLILFSPEVNDTFVVFFCAMIRKSVIQNIGLLDTDTLQTGFGEDMDFCKKAKLAGWKIAQVPGEELKPGAGMWGGSFPIYHAGGETVNKLPNWLEIVEKNRKALRERYGT